MRDINFPRQTVFWVKNLKVKIKIGFRDATWDGTIENLRDQFGLARNAHSFACSDT
jgi:hypothetical protein